MNRYSISRLRKGKQGIFIPKHEATTQGFWRGLSDCSSVSNSYHISFSAESQTPPSPKKVVAIRKNNVMVTWV